MHPGSLVTSFVFIQTMNSTSYKTWKMYIWTSLPFLNSLHCLHMNGRATHEWEGYTWMGGLHMIGRATHEWEGYTWIGLHVKGSSAHEWEDYAWMRWLYLRWLHIYDMTTCTYEYDYTYLGLPWMGLWTTCTYDWENDTWIGLNYIWLGERYMNGTELYMTGRTIHEWDWTTYDWENDTWMGLYKVPTVFLFLFIIDKHVHTSTLIALATLQCAFLSISPYSRGSSVIYNHKHMDQIAILMIWREVARSVFYAGG